VLQTKAADIKGLLESEYSKPKTESFKSLPKPSYFDIQEPLYSHPDLNPKETYNIKENAPSSFEIITKDTPREPYGWLDFRTDEEKAVE
jgi:hypothetical protein